MAWIQISNTVVLKDKFTFHNDAIKATLTCLIDIVHKIYKKMNEQSE